MYPSLLGWSIGVGGCRGRCVSDNLYCKCNTCDIIKYVGLKSDLLTKQRRVTEIALASNKTAQAEALKFHSTFSSCRLHPNPTYLLRHCYRSLNERHTAFKPAFRMFLYRDDYAFRRLAMLINKINGVQQTLFGHGFKTIRLICM